MSVLDFINANSQQDANIRAIVKAKYELTKTSIPAKQQQLQAIIAQNEGLLRAAARNRAAANPNIAQETEDIINTGIDEVVSYLQSNYDITKGFKENYWNAINALHQQQQRQTPPGQTPPGQTPPGQTPPGQTPPGQTPPGQTPPGQTPPGQTPPGQTPPGQTPPGQTPPGQTPPNPNLPLISGLQIYDRVLQEVGYIKGTKAIKAHDVLEHLPVVKLLGPPLIRLFTGRKKEMKRIADSIEGIDFQQEYGISEDQAMELMIQDCLLKDGKRSVSKLKVNDIFLRALKQKLDKDMPRKTQQLEQLRQQTLQEIEQRKTERQTADPQRQAQIDIELGNLYAGNQRLVRGIEHYHDQSDDIEAARVAKSYRKRDNIEGLDAAVRDLDSRDAIHRAAEAERKQLSAIQQGGIDAATGKTADFYAYELAELMAGETATKKAFIGKGRVSIGAFDSPLGTAKVMSDKDNTRLDTIGGIGLGLCLGAGVFARQLNQMGDMMIAQQQAQFKLQQGLNQAQAQVDQQTAAANNLSNQIQGIKGTPTQGDAAYAVRAVRKPVVDAQDMGERTSEFVGGFHEGSQAYIDADSANVAFTNQQLKAADSYISQHSGKAQDPLGAMIDAMKQKVGLQRQNAGLVNDAQNAASSYYGSPAHLVSGGNVDHTATAALESTGRAIAETADIHTQEVAINVLEQLQNISAQNFARIDLTQYVDLSSLIAATKGRGIDLLAILAPSIVAVDNVAKDQIRNQGR